MVLMSVSNLLGVFHNMYIENCILIYLTFILQMANCVKLTARQENQGMILLNLLLFQIIIITTRDTMKLLVK